jgi:hypothetical protein
MDVLNWYSFDFLHWAVASQIVTGSHADQTRSHAGNHSALDLHPPLYSYHAPPPLPNNISGGSVQLVNGPQAGHPCLPVLGYHTPAESFSYAQGPGYQIPTGYAPSASYQIPAGMLQLLHTPRLLDFPPLLPLLQPMDMARFPGIPWLLVIPRFLDIPQFLDISQLLDTLPGCWISSGFWIHRSSKPSARCHCLTCI